MSNKTSQPDQNKMKWDREMQLCVVVENIVSSKLVQLSQHAQSIVGLEFLVQGNWSRWLGCCGHLSQHPSWVGFPWLSSIGEKLTSPSSLRLFSLKKCIQAVKLSRLAWGNNSDFQPWRIQPAHGEACRRRFPKLYAEFPRLAVGKPKTKALEKMTTRMIEFIK